MGRTCHPLSTLLITNPKMLSWRHWLCLPSSSVNISPDCRLINITYFVDCKVFFFFLWPVQLNSPNSAIQLKIVLNIPRQMTHVDLYYYSTTFKSLPFDLTLKLCQVIFLLLVSSK